MAKIIIIDTSDNKKISVRLQDGALVKQVFSQSVVLRSEAALPLIDKILTENNTNLGEVTEIKVNLGPGSFTGLRVGAAIANSLGFVLNIPINGGKIGELVTPVYN